MTFNYTFTATIKLSSSGKKKYLYCTDILKIPDSDFQT